MFVLTTRQMIFGQILMLRGHFGVIKDNAEFYSKVSDLYILPTLDEVNSLPVHASKEEQQLAAAKLTSSATESAKAIGLMARQVRQD